MFFNKRRNVASEGELKIFLDIRSSSVGGAVVSVSEESPVVKQTIRKHVYSYEPQESTEFIAQLMKALDAVLGDLSKLGAVKEVTCALSSPWYESQIKNFSIKQDSPIKFTEDFVEKILKKEKATDQTPGDQVGVDKKIVSVRLNGYETPEPIGQTAKQIDLSFYSSTMSKTIQSEIADRIRNHFHPKKINFVTHPLVIMKSVKNLFHSLNDFVTMDIGGETTDISLFKNSALHSIVTIPNGTHHFVRELEQACSFDKGVALSHLNMMYGEELNDRCSEKTSKIVKDAEKVWLGEMRDAVNDAWEGQTVPPTVFMTVDAEAKTLFKTIINSREGYRDALGINREPILHVIDHSNIKDLCNYESSVTKDPLLSLIVFSDKI